MQQTNSTQYLFSTKELFTQVLGYSLTSGLPILVFANLNHGPRSFSRFASPGQHLPS